MSALAALPLRDPRDLRHPSLPERAVLTARVLAMAWLVTGHAFFQPRLFVPFGFACEPSPFVAGPALAVIEAFACLAVLATPFVRTGSLVLASGILVATLSSLGYAAYNRVFVAALLFVLAVAPSSRVLALARGQVALVYLGAALDKAFDPDFRAGRVIAALVDTLATSGPVWSPSVLAPHVHPWPSLLEACLGSSVAPYVGLAWAVIGAELALAFGHLAGARFVRPLAWALHGSILLVSGSTFGMFFYAMLAATELVGPRPERAGRTLGLAALFASPLMRPELALVSAVGAGLGRVLGEERADESDERA